MKMQMLNSWVCTVVWAVWFVTAGSTLCSGQGSRHLKPYGELVGAEVRHPLKLDGYFEGAEVRLKKPLKLYSTERNIGVSSLQTGDTIIISDYGGPWTYVVYRGKNLKARTRKIDGFLIRNVKAAKGIPNEIIRKRDTVVVSMLREKDTGLRQIGQGHQIRAIDSMLFSLRVVEGKFGAVQDRVVNELIQLQATIKQLSSRLPKTDAPPQSQKMGQDTMPSEITYEYVGPPVAPDPGPSPWPFDVAWAGLAIGLIALLLSIYTLSQLWFFRKMDKNRFKISNGLISYDADAFINIPQKNIGLKTGLELSRALIDFLSSLGFELVSEQPPVIGSFRQKLAFRHKAPNEASLRQKYEEAQQILERGQLQIQAVKASAKQIAAAARLLAEVNKVDQALVRVGPLFIVKATTNGTAKLIVETLTPEQAMALDQKPTFASDPVMMANFFSTR